MPLLNRDPFCYTILSSFSLLRLLHELAKKKNLSFRPRTTKERGNWQLRKREKGQEEEEDEVKNSLGTSDFFFQDLFFISQRLSIKNRLRL